MKIKRNHFKQDKIFQNRFNQINLIKPTPRQAKASSYGYYNKIRIR